MIAIPKSGVIETSKTYCWVDKNLLFSIAKDKAYLNIEDAIEVRTAFQQLTDRPLPLLVDMHTTSGQSSETREFFSKDPDHNALIKATALYAINPVARVVGNIYIGLVKTEKPLKIFNDYDKAIDWLETFN